ncbi:MAG TPA: hypothetical protein DC049_04555 [Spirochaetia bacterium]|nr:hypothetical protein [Spirochaetia bacterium]
MLTDTNVWIGSWPFAKTGISDISHLSAHLEKEGIDRAWVAPLDAIFYSDCGIGNDTWLPEICRHKQLRPVAVINPSMQNWQDTIIKAENEWGVRIIKLVPGYHLYNLASENIFACVEYAIKENILISIQIRMEDERRHHPLMKVPSCSIDDIRRLVRRYPETLFHIASAYFSEAVLLKDLNNIILEISGIEHLDTVNTIGKYLPYNRLCFGSHTPLYYTRSAILKIQKSTCSAEDLEIVKTGGKLRDYLKNF